ncbi:MAG: multicopper oxidase domain-containing protein [Thermodesulfobacteriota bacterium]
MKRREFLKMGIGGLAALVVGSEIPWITENNVYAGVRVQALNFHIMDALKDMGTNSVINPAQCYFWIYKEDRFPPECPGPHIFTTEGDVVKITITNHLDESHAFFIPGIFNSGPIAPGETVRKFFTANKTGTFLYYDNLNTPVNRVMGLHGAFIVMPKAPAAGHKFTPYSRPTAAVQRLFDDLGSTPWFPGLSWEARDPSTLTPAFRQYIWILHQASPNLFGDVGDYTPGQDFPAAQFVNRFLHDPFDPEKPTFNAIPQYFTINGQSGHFSTNSPYLTPMHRVGEPVVLRFLNAGFWTHSMHIHANHVFVISVNGQVQKNLLRIDTFDIHPLGAVDWLGPYIRPPDIPNQRGIGRADPGLPTLTGGTTWPPNEELHTFIPDSLSAKDQFGNQISLAVQLSPQCYPMHDHSEPSQTSQGGNYNMGMISGIEFIGDRNTPGAMNFPNQPIVHGPGPLGVFTPAIPPPWFGH